MALAPLSGTTNDLRTPLSEAKQLYNALQIREIETALVEIPGASHFISNRPSQLSTRVLDLFAPIGKGQRGRQHR